MHISIFDNPQSVSLQEWQQDYLLLPKWRQQRAASYHFLLDKVLCAKAYLLLRDSLRKHYGIESELEFEYLTHGKPVLKDYPHIHFNLSHCSKAVLCVVDDRPVGCDIETIPASIDMELVRHCFNSDEIGTIQSSPKAEQEFTRLWTIKESVLKLSGVGLSEDLPSLLTTPTYSKYLPHTMIEPQKGYAYSIVQDYS